MVEREEKFLFDPFEWWKISLLLPFTSFDFSTIFQIVLNDIATTINNALNKFLITESAARPGSETFLQL